MQPRFRRRRSQGLLRRRSRRRGPSDMRDVRSGDHNRAGHPGDNPEDGPRWFVRPQPRHRAGRAQQHRHAGRRPPAPHWWERDLQFRSWHRTAQRMGRCAERHRRQRQNNCGNRTSHDGLRFLIQFGQPFSVRAPFCSFHGRCRDDFSGIAATGVRSHPSRRASARISGRLYAAAPSKRTSVLLRSAIYYEICARIRRTPAEDDCSFLMWKRPISEVRFTCGPPQNSSDTSPIL